MVQNEDMDQSQTLLYLLDTEQIYTLCRKDIFSEGRGVVPLQAAGDLLVGEAVVDVAGHAPRVCLGPHHELLREERMGSASVLPSSGRSTCTQRVSLSRLCTETEQKLPLEIYVCFCEQ